MHRTGSSSFRNGLALYLSVYEIIWGIDRQYDIIRAMLFTVEWAVNFSARARLVFRARMDAHCERIVTAHSK